VSIRSAHPLKASLAAALPPSNGSIPLLPPTDTLRPRVSIITRGVIDDGSLESVELSVIVDKRATNEENGAADLTPAGPNQTSEAANDAQVDIILRSENKPLANESI
jgi:hypothetical protein